MAVEKTPATTTAEDGGSEQSGPLLPAAAHHADAGDGDGDGDSETSKDRKDTKNRKDSKDRKDSSAEMKLAKGLKSKHQLRNLVLQNAAKWFIGIVILVFIFATLKIFADLGNTSNTTKRWFNVIITGFNIMLAINFFSSLGDLAKILRWRVLAETPHSMRDVDLILSADSLSKLTALAFRYFELGFMKLWNTKKDKTRRRKHRDTRNSLSYFKSATKICLWLLLNIAAQAVIALIGLTYGDRAGELLLPPPIGPTFRSDLTHYYTLLSSESAPRNKDSEQLAAHQLGDIGLVFNTQYINNINDSITFTNSEAYYYIPVWDWPDPTDSFVGQRWVYRYFNYDAPSFYEYQYSVPTERTISTTWDNCFRYPVISGAGIPQSNATVTYEFPDGSNNTILVDIVGKGATTFIYPGPHNDVCLTPNPRCSPIMAFQEPFEDYASHVYYCEVTVGNIMNDDGTRADHDLPDVQAKYAAASAGLSGFGTTESVFVKTGEVTGQQFERYSHDSWWNLARNASAVYAGSTMAQFAISSLAAMSEFNPKIASIGPSKSVGVILQVEWWAIRILLPCIAAAHTILIGLAVYLANHYVIHDDSNLANAQLIAPLLERAGLSRAGTGSTLTGKEIAELVDDGLGNQEILYGIKPAEQPEGSEEKQDQHGSFWLGVSEELKGRRALLRKQHTDSLDP